MNQSNSASFLKRCSRSSNVQEDKPNLSKTKELMEKLQEQFKHLDLKNTLIISVQHLCSTTEILFEALFKLNLSPSNLHVSGKCYSTNPEVLYRLLEKGVRVSSSSNYFNSLTPFDLCFENSLERMLRNITNNSSLESYKRIIILDDGGHLIKKIEQLLPKNLPLVGVEQTSSGFNNLIDTQLSFPIVNLARSQLKLEKESPIILNLVLRKLKEKLFQLGSRIKKILIIGYGVLGKGLYEALQDKYIVSFFDSIPQRSRIKSHCFKSSLSEFDLIIGCTGSTSIFYDDYKFLKKPVVLASISSSDREFEAHRIRQFQSTSYCHTDIVVDGITLLNCGFPITFDADYDGIDTDDFRLTRALIFVSIVQALSADLSLKGFVELKKDLQSLVIDRISEKSSKGEQSPHFEFKTEGNKNLETPKASNFEQLDELCRDPVVIEEI